MANEIIFLIEEAPEGGYSVRALGYSILTEAETVEDLRTEIVDAVQCHFDEKDSPELVRLHFVRDEVFSV